MSWYMQYYKILFSISLSKERSEKNVNKKTIFSAF